MPRASTAAGRNGNSGLRIIESSCNALLRILPLPEKTLWGDPITDEALQA
jgi:hypothetical protein